jgi:SAM-dependent methyltransferase
MDDRPLSRSFELTAFEDEPNAGLNSVPAETARRIESDVAPINDHALSRATEGTFTPMSEDRTSESSSVDRPATDPRTSDNSRTARRSADAIAAFNRRVNFGRTALDYQQHRAGFPESFFPIVSRLGIGTPGQKLLDLGTGTGTLARGFAKRGCRVTGVDPAPAMLRQARQLDRSEKVRIHHVCATAEQTGLEGNQYDVVTAGQCWHWFERDKAALEARRLLANRGKILIAHFDWIPLANNVAARTEALIEHYNPAWYFGGGTGMYPDWLADLALAGFERLETFSYDEAATYTHQAWRGRIRASAGIAAMLDEPQVAQFDRDLESMLQEHFPQDPLEVPHRVFVVVGHAPR